MAARAKKLILVSFLCLIVLSIRPGHVAYAGPEYEGDRGQVLVPFAAGLSDEERGDYRACHGLSRVLSLAGLDIELQTWRDVRSAAEIAAELAGSDLVEWAEPNQLCRVALAEPNDPAYHDLIEDWYLQWPVHVLAALTAWDYYPAMYFDTAARPLDAPVVALIDTGVDPNHPDFKNPGATSTDVADGGQLMLAASRTFLASGGGATDEATDEHGHGTHLAGLVAAATNNGVTAGSGIAGLGYPVRLLPIKVTDETGTATHADVAQAIVYAADQDASVILIGLAGPTWSRTLQEAVDYAWNLGCFLVAPAGDAACSQPMFPAACPHVFGVAATTVSGSLSWYSSSGDQVALAAPGGDETAGVYSMLPTYACTLRTDLSGPAYGSLFGTSQAAAHVAGAAALYAGARGCLPVTGGEGKGLWQALQESATRAPGTADGAWDPGWGYGSVAPASLLSGERPQGAVVGGLVGRVLCDTRPASDVTVTAMPEAGGDWIAVRTTWPAGTYRLASLPAGVYRVIVWKEGKSGSWEGVEVRSGCDIPGIDFRLGDPPADASLAGAHLPGSAVRGRETELSITFVNTGKATWTRAAGHCLRLLGGHQWEMLPQEEVIPGQAREFAVLWPAPDSYGFYEMALQMCQQGGVGRFGEVARGVVSVTSFLDVPADHWAVSAIEAVKDADIVRGYGGDLYRPEWAVTRDQMAVYVARGLAGGDSAVPPGPAIPTFADVSTKHWAYGYVEYAAANGVVQGYWDGYRPDEVVDRAQMAVFMARAMAGGESGVPDSSSITPPFPDVPCDFWACKYIEYLKSAEVVGGYPDGLYHPEMICTRDQMAVYVAGAFDLQMEAGAQGKMKDVALRPAASF